MNTTVANQRQKAVQAWVKLRAKREAVATPSPPSTARSPAPKECRFATTATYIERVNLAVDHVVNHLHEPLRLRDLSRAAMLSPFHFHRVFQALVGATPAEFVKPFASRGR